MKKILITILIFILSNQQAVIAQESDTAINKIRTVRIKGNKIILQTNIEKLKEVTIKSIGDHYYLKKGTFRGTDSIDIEVNRNNQTTAVSFFYDTVSTYDYEVNLFNKHLNLIGKESQLMYKNSTMKVTKWEDKHTAFEMVEVRTGNKWKLYSVIFDKKLYFKKVKQCVKLTKNENSLEILKRLGAI